MIRIGFQKLVDFAQVFLVTKGVPDENARTIAEIVVATEASESRHTAWSSCHTLKAPSRG